MEKLRDRRCETEEAARSANAASISMVITRESG